jgi:hypothetical protein
LRFLCPLLKRQPRSLTKFQDWVQPKLRNFVSYPNWYRTLTLGKESSPNRVQQPISIAEDVANTELHKRSVKETPLIRPSTSRANGNDNWIFNKICLVVHILLILFFDYLNCGLILKKVLFTETVLLTIIHFWIVRPNITWKQGSWSWWTRSPKEICFSWKFTWKKFKFSYQVLRQIFVKL